MDTKLIAVVELLERGVWEEAHGIVHALEGDLESAEHWYRNAKRTFRGPDAVRAEIATARELLARTG